MNPLQEHANLFANGKFKVKLPNGEMLHPEPWEFLILRNIEDCTLIARPIEDMTEGEIKQTEAFKDFEEYINTDNSENSFDYVREAEDGRIFNAHDTAYLLSIGVYPFDQQAFDDGTVININEI